MKRWAPVEVIWADAHGSDEGWRDITSLSSKPREIRTVGQLARESSEVIVVALSHDRTSKTVSGHIVIPRCNVVSITELLPKERA